MVVGVVFGVAVAPVAVMSVGGGVRGGPALNLELAHGLVVLLRCVGASGATVKVGGGGGNFHQGGA